MTVIIDGTNGVSDVDGSASTPAIRGTDANTGIFFPAADTIAFAEGGVEAMRIDSSGNVGIGTSSPSAFGGTNLQVQNSNIASVLWSNGTITGQLLCSSGAEVTVGSRSNHPLRFGTNDTERARIDTTGKFLVGSTNSAGGQFKVQAASNICFSVENATVVSGALTLSTINDAATVNVPLDFRASSIHASSGIATTANAANANFSAGENNKFYRSTSALKYKQDIRDIELIDINRFRPVRYKSKCEDDDQTKDHFGIIADEVHAAGLTELVTYGVEQEVEGFQYERLTVVLLKHCQEQQAIIQSLTDRIAALEAKG